VQLVQDAEAADVILFAEWAGDVEDDVDAVQRIMRSPLYRDYARKIIVHCGMDIPRPLIPGFYPSLPRQWAASVGCLGGPFLNDTNPFLIGPATDSPPELLASFFGSCDRKPVRQRLVNEASDAAWRDIPVRDTSHEFIGTLRRGDRDGHNELKRRFASDMLNSKFALCPKGAGASSYRIFEAMQVGRAPVIIADDWLPPVGPDWSSFAIEVAERDIKRLPALLHEREHEWRSRGDRAKAAWNLFYSPQKIGLTVIRQANGLLESLKSRRTFISFAAAAYVHGPRRTGILRTKVSRKFERTLAAAE
jgi:exostosin family protein